MRLALPLILFAATLSLALGMVLPLIRVERLFVFADEPSLVGMIQGLWQEGDWALSQLSRCFQWCFRA